jgi:DNA-binding beta-propeller fold protein YncE
VDSINGMILPNAVIRAISSLLALACAALLPAVTTLWADPPAPVVTENTGNLAGNALFFTMSGANFDPVASNNLVTLNRGAVGVVTSANATTLVVTFTTEPTTSGSLTAVVTTNGVSSGSPVQVGTLVNSYVLSTRDITEGPAAGTDTVTLVVTPEDGPWTATASDSWLHTSASGTGSSNILFTFDANPGPTRSGVIIVAGQALTVTQAGASYLPVGMGALTTLVSTNLYNPAGVAVDGAGNVYFADSNHDAIKVWTAATNSVSTLISTGVNDPVGIAVDGAANLYIADKGNHAIKKWTAATGTLSTLVSSGLSYPSAVALDGAGNVYIADSNNNAIKKWTAATQTVSTLVSTGLNFPMGVAVDRAGNVFFSDTYNNAVKVWSAATQTVSTLVSGGLNEPMGLAVDGSGNVYIADMIDGVVRKWVAATESMTDLAYSGVSFPWGVALDGIGNVYLTSSQNNKVMELPVAYVDPTSKLETIASGTDALPAVLPTSENLSLPFAPSSDQSWLTVGPVSDGVVNFGFPTNNSGGGRTAHIALLNQNVTVTQQGPAPTVTTSSADLAAGAYTVTIQGTGFDPTPSSNTVILSNGATGTVTSATGTTLVVSFATRPGLGSLTAVVTTDGLSSGVPVQVATVVTSYELATSALTEGPAAGTDTVILVVTPESASWTATANASWLHTSASGAGSGNVLFTFDANPGATRTGTLTIAGQTLTITQAASTYVPATPVTPLDSSGLHYPQSLAVDGAGNVYVANSYDSAVMKWTMTTNTMGMLFSEVGGPYGVAVDGDGSVYFSDLFSGAVKKWTAATQTKSTLVSTGLNFPYAIAVDAAGNVYIADGNNSAIKKWTAATNTVSTLVSTGLNSPTGVAVDAAGNVYIADFSNRAVKKWTAATQTVSTLVSSGLSNPYSVAVDTSGNVYITDYNNNAVKKWNAATNIVTTLVSTGLASPTGVAVDANGNVYISDDGNNVIRELPRAFVDPSPKYEVTSASASDSLPVVLPSTESLLAPFAPTSDQTWLTIDSVSGGIVNFSVSPNAGSTRTAHISLLGQSIAVTQPGPVIIVQQPAGQNLTSGSLIDFGSSYTGYGATKTFTIRNNGSSNLTLSTPSIDGANSADFAVTTGPVSPVVALGSTTFVVTFTPKAAGSRGATLHIPSNDPFTSTFNVALQGTGVLISTTAATNVTSGWAMLNGSANPNGLATTGFFQYGTTTGYGSSTGFVNFGAGSSTVPASFNLAGLTKNTTYHYRLVISNSQGTFAGADQTFTTNATTSPAAWHSAQVTALTNRTANNMADGARTGAAHNSWYLYYYKGTDNNVWCVYWTGAQWSQVQLSTDGNVSDWLCFGTAYNLCCYQGRDGKLWCVYWSGAAWVTVQLGNSATGVTVAGDVVVDQGWNIIYYRGSDSKIYAVQWNGSQWKHTLLGSAATVKAALAVDQVQHLVYYQGTDNKLWCYQWTGAVWQQVLLGSNTNVSGGLAVDQRGLLVYYRSSADNSAWTLYWTGTAWVQQQLNSSANMNASVGSFSGIAPYPQQYTTLYLDGNGQGESLYWSGSAWVHILLGDGGSGLTGGLSLQPTIHWAFARRSDGNVVVFYYQ